MRTVALIPALLMATVAFGDDDRRWGRNDDDRYGNGRYGNDRYGNDRYGNDRYGNDRYGYGGTYRGGAGVVQRVMSNLSRAQSYRIANGGVREDFEKARYNLERFQVNWSRGNFDKDRLDGAIDHLKDLARSDRVHPRDRQMFARDIEDLRAFRASGGSNNGRWRY